jgi:hypothetical protein
VRSGDCGIVDISGCVGYKERLMAHLFIVSRQQPDLYSYLLREFSEEADVRIVLDRRYGERRQPKEPRNGDDDERRSNERRAQNDINSRLATLGYAFVRIS